MLEDKQDKLDVLRQLLVDGEKSGEAEYSYEILIAELDDEDEN